jgi:hypothetical protein
MKMPTVPMLSITFVAKSTIGPVMEAVGKGGKWPSVLNGRVA